MNVKVILFDGFFLKMVDMVTSKFDALAGLLKGAVSITFSIFGICDHLVGRANGRVLADCPVASSSSKQARTLAVRISAGGAGTAATEKSRAAVVGICVIGRWRGGPAAAGEDALLTGGRVVVARVVDVTAAG